MASRLQICYPVIRIGWLAERLWKIIMQHNCILSSWCLYSWYKKPCLFFFLLWNFLHYRHWWTWDSSEHDWWVFVFIRPWEILLCSTDVASHNTFLHGRFLRSRLMKKFLVCNRSTKMEVTQSEFNPAYMGTFSNGVNFWRWTNQKYFYCCWCYICIIIVVFFACTWIHTGCCLCASDVLLKYSWFLRTASPSERPSGSPRSCVHRHNGSQKQKQSGMGQGIPSTSQNGRFHEY